MQTKTPPMSWAGLAASGIGVVIFFVVAAVPFATGGATDEGYYQSIVTWGLVVSVILGVGCILAFVGFWESRAGDAVNPSATAALVTCALVFVPAVIWCLTLPFMIN